MATSTPPASSLLQNIYYERKVGTARPCYVCRRPTETVLATIKSEDFLYTCVGHLSDPGFATQISAPATASTGPTPEDIRKVISEYTARQAQKADTAKDAIKHKDKEEKDDENENDKKDKDGKNEKPLSTNSIQSSSIPVSPSAPTPSHRKFALHRALFEARKTELRKREQGARAREMTRGMPQVPRGTF